MAFRRPMTKQKSRKNFSKYGSKTHKKNVQMPARGGNRL